MNRVPLALALLLVTTLAGCNSNEPAMPRACTLIGCVSGLQVEITGALPAAYSLRVDVTGSSTAPRTITCDAGTQCANPVMFEDFTPDSVVVELRADTAVRRIEQRVTYQTSQPNGPGCPPTCRQAMIRIGL